MAKSTNNERSQGRLSPERAGRLMRAATYASVSVAGTLVIAKLAAWVATDSVSMLSTLIDSMLDVGASLVTFFAVRHSLQPADHEHRFGHGKAESLGGLAEAAFVLGSGIFVFGQAMSRLLFPQELSNTDLGYAVMVLGMVMSASLVVFQKYVVRKTGSLAIGAESLNYQNDILVNASVIVSLYVTTQFGWLAADPLFAIGIASFICWGAWRIGRQALDVLMDRELPDEERENIRGIAQACDGVLGVHDLRTRSSGTSLFIQLHLVMADDLPLKPAHELVERVEMEMAKVYPHAEVLIHPDPVSVVPEESRRIRRSRLGAKS
ncbi:MAG: cation diffusion facilitator family transporter [Rhodospirillales bacterium]|jgi:ferrous-iron efflux pump FieF|nr:cation diffusion facilitator family transporter [Rhodospirillales bacterium]